MLVKDVILCVHLALVPLPRTVNPVILTSTLFDRLQHVRSTARTVLMKSEEASKNVLIVLIIVQLVREDEMFVHHAKTPSINKDQIVNLIALLT